jgi:signal transduction histidine kinase
LPQPKLDGYQPGRFRSAALPMLLVIALGVTGIVTYHAYQASREHRAVVERVLAAYVSFVTERVQESTQSALYSCAEMWLHPVMTQRGNDRTSGIRVDGSCGARDGGRFELDLQNHRTIASEGMDQRMLSWLLATIPRTEEIERMPGWHIGMLTTTVGSRPELIPYAVYKQGAKEIKAVGFVALGALDSILKTAPTLVPVPKQMAAAGALTDYFHITNNKQVTAAKASQNIFFTQERPLATQFGGITVAVGLLNAGLYRLAPEGLPRQRGLELFGLFALAACLVACSALLLRREEQLARTRANFVSGVSHELRTPLAQIRMFAEMLLLGRVRTEADRRRSLEIIDTEARRLSQLVDNVLQVARSENGHLHVNPIAMRLAPIMRECVESFTMLAQARGIQFRPELQEDLIAPIDSAALRQIVLNLLDNAAKYGPDGQRVVVGLALFEGRARIWVDDEGEGIPVRERERVFAPFYRIRNAQNATGSGIGLAVVRELVALHGGDAWIEDAPDAGARVVVQFPGASLSAEQATEDFAVA